MATDTLATADAILKDLLRGPIREQTNYKTWMLDKIERDSERVDFEGRRAIMPLHTSQNPSEGSISDGGTLATPGIEGYAGRDHPDPLRQLGPRADGPADQAGEEGPGRVRGRARRPRRADGEGLPQEDQPPDLRRPARHAGDARDVAGGGDDVHGRLDAVPEDRPDHRRPHEDDGRARERRQRLADDHGDQPHDEGRDGLGRVTATTTTAGVYIAGSYGLEVDGLRFIGATAAPTPGSTRRPPATSSGTRRSARRGAVAGESLFEQLADDVGAEGEGEIDVFLTTRGIRRRWRTRTSRPSG
jgi:hypothetical protein